MVDVRKRPVLGVAVDVIDYDGAVSRIVQAAMTGQPFAASAVAVHGIMTAVERPAYRAQLNGLDLLVPDGQPVRWALNILHNAELNDRVYGPTLMARLMSVCAENGLPVYLYGSRARVLNALVGAVARRYPALKVAGAEPGSYRPSRPGELADIARRISLSGARVVFVGLGCPRQELFSASLRSRTDVPLLGVGAAFDYHAGLLRRPPEKLQQAGLEWLWRLGLEPRRLWRRYLLLNPKYVALVALQRVTGWEPEAQAPSQCPPLIVDV